MLAIWGYKAIKEEAGKIAATASKSAAYNYIKGKDVQINLREEIRKIIDEEIGKVKEGLDLAASQPDQGVPSVESRQDSEKVGRPYNEGKEGR